MKNYGKNFPLSPKVNWWRLPEEVDALSKTISNLSLNQLGPLRFVDNSIQTILEDTDIEIGSTSLNANLISNLNLKLATDKKVVFDNYSRIGAGINDFNGSGGVSLFCTVGYELNYQAGKLRVFQEGNSYQHDLDIATNLNISDSSTLTLTKADYRRNIVFNDEGFTYYGTDENDNEKVILEIANLNDGNATLFFGERNQPRNNSITMNDGLFVVGVGTEQFNNSHRSLAYNPTTGEIVANSGTNQSFNPLFTDASGTLSGVNVSGSYTMIAPKICYFRIYIDFSTCDNFGTGQYQFTLPFTSVETMRQAGGTLHQTTGTSLYHIAGITDINIDPTIQKLYYSGSTTDLIWKYNTPVGGTTVTSHFDISGIYEIA